MGAFHLIPKLTVAVHESGQSPVSVLFHTGNPSTDLVHLPVDHGRDDQHDERAQVAQERTAEKPVEHVRIIRADRNHGKRRHQRDETDSGTYDNETSVRHFSEAIR